MHTMFKDSLAGKVALVTGAGSGIGKATAKLFGYAGARVAVLTRSGDEAEATCDEIRRGNGDALALLADISDGAQLAEGFRKIQETWGRLDIVVANAGINGLWAPIEELTEKDWEAVFDINLKGTFLTVKHSVPLLKKQGGAIVIVSSVNGTRIFSNAGASARAISSAGVRWCETLLVRFNGAFHGSSGAPGPAWGHGAGRSGSSRRWGPLPTPRPGSRLNFLVGYFYGLTAIGKKNAPERTAHAFRLRSVTACLPSILRRQPGT